MRCQKKCLTKMSSKLGGSCGDLCALESEHEGRCKCAMMVRIDAVVTPLPASTKDSLEDELRRQWRKQKNRRDRKATDPALEDAAMRSADRRRQKKRAEPEAAE